MLLGPFKTHARQVYFFFVLLAVNDRYVKFVICECGSHTIYRIRDKHKFGEVRQTVCARARARVFT